jgi:hypothetical protein
MRPSQTSGRPFALFFLILCLSVSGCRSSKNVSPTIEFTQIPEAVEGGPDRLATIAGRVHNARPGQQIVLYAKSERWWVQPRADRPSTAIGPDGTWKNLTHLGTEYAVILVEPGYHPGDIIDALPAQGGHVLAVSTTKGTPAPKVESKTLNFSGYDWTVRNIPGDRNGSANAYDTRNAWVDSSGFLHLRVTGNPHQWFCSEVIQNRNLGYGTYRFTLHDISHIEPALALSLFTWDTTAAMPGHRELTIEFSRWGDPGSKDGQFIVQPYYVAANVTRFEAPPGRIDASFRWEPGKASFEAAPATGRTAHPFAAHVFTSGVPTPGDERLRMHLCGFRYSKVPLQREGEVVIEKFQYLP